MVVGLLDIMRGQKFRDDGMWRGEREATEG